jgi:hypothetical protein
MSAACRKCGTSVPPDDAFCDDCVCPQCRGLSRPTGRYVTLVKISKTSTQQTRKVLSRNTVQRFCMRRRLGGITIDR